MSGTGSGLHPGSASNRIHKPSNLYLKDSAVGCLAKVKTWHGNNVKT